MRWQGLIVGVGIMVASIVAGAGASPTAAHGEVEHVLWDRVIQQFVGDGLVDYQGIANDRSMLDDYLGFIADAHVADLPSKESQLAFWINAYNASVVKGVLDQYPLASVKDVKGFFETIRSRVAGEDLTLNEIESRGRALGDWRIHFAVVCASSSCPGLRPEAYVPERLEQQLAEQTQAFLAHPQRGVRIDEAASTVWLSRIFDWYREDFGQARVAFGLLGAPFDLQKLVNDLEPWLVPDALATIRGGTWKVRFMEYDWTLNDVPQD